MSNPSAILESINPATGQIIGRTPVSSPESIKESVRKSRYAFQHWSQTPLPERLALIKRFAQVLLKKRKACAQLITAESGKPVSEALTEIFSLLETCAWLQKNSGLLKAEKLQLNKLFFRSKTAQTVYEPLGCIAIISPWNFPFSIPGSSILSALTAGNAVLLKPSPKTPLVAEFLVELLREAGLPGDLVQIIHGDKDEARALLEEDLDRVLFTGSVPGGRAIMQLASQKLTPMTLELGGKHPAIVLEDADLEKCADAIVWASFTNAGQACASIERLYVVESRHDELLQILQKKTAALRLGDPSNPKTDIGPLIDKTQQQRVKSMIERARAQGAAIACGGRELSEIDAKLAAKLPGYFLEPTILSGVKQDMEIVREEIFGPVLPVVKVNNRSEAIAFANDSMYGLGASIWTKDIKVGEALAGKLKCGMVWINDGLFSHACPQAPWGGIKYSGSGRTHGKHALLDFVNIKLIAADKPGRRDWNFPHSKASYSLIDSAICTLHASSLLSRIGNAARLAFAWLRTR